MLASGKLRLFAAAAHGRRRKQLQHPCWAPHKMHRRNRIVHFVRTAITCVSSSNATAR